MADFLEFTFEKFTFKVATDRLYSREGIWVYTEDEEFFTLGMSDYLQQRSGDLAFAEIYEQGTEIKSGGPFADIETIKSDVQLSCPLEGVITAVNINLDFEPELINHDPYGDGWMVMMDALDWQRDQANLLTPQAYLAYIKLDAQEAVDES